MTSPEDWIEYSNLLTIERVQTAFRVAEPRLVKASPGYVSLTPETIAAYVTLIPPESLDSFSIMSGWSLNDLRLMADPDSVQTNAFAWNQETPMLFFARPLSYLKQLYERHELTKTSYYYLKVKLINLCFKLAKLCGPTNSYHPRDESSLVLRSYLTFETPSWHEAKAQSVIHEQLKNSPRPNSESRTVSIIPEYIRPIRPAQVPPYLKELPPTALSIPFPVGLSKYPPPTLLFDYSNGATSNGGLSSMDWDLASSASTSGAKVPSQGNPHIPVQIPPITWHQPNFGPRGIVPPPKGQGNGPGSNPNGPFFQFPAAAPRAPFQLPGGAVNPLPHAGHQLQHAGQPVRPVAPLQLPAHPAPAQNAPHHNIPVFNPFLPHAPVHAPNPPQHQPPAQIHNPPQHQPPAQVHNPPQHQPPAQIHNPPQHQPPAQVHNPPIKAPKLSAFLPVHHQGVKGSLPMALPDRPQSAQPILHPTVPVQNAATPLTRAEDIQAILHSVPPVHAAPVQGFIPYSNGSFTLGASPVNSQPDTLWEQFIKQQRADQERERERIRVGIVSPSASSVTDVSDEGELYNGAWSPIPTHTPIADRPPPSYTPTILAPSVPHLPLGNTSAIHSLPLAPPADVSRDHHENLAELAEIHKIAYDKAQRDGDALQQLQAQAQLQVQTITEQMERHYKEREEAEKQIHHQQKLDIVQEHEIELQQRRLRYHAEIQAVREASNYDMRAIQMELDAATVELHRLKANAGSLDYQQTVQAHIDKVQAKYDVEVQALVDKTQKIQDAYLEDDKRREAQFSDTIKELEARKEREIAELKQQQATDHADIRQQFHTTAENLQRQLQDAEVTKQLLQYQLRDAIQKREQEVAHITELSRQELEEQRRNTQALLEQQASELRDNYQVELKRATAAGQDEVDQVRLVQKTRLEALEQARQEADVRHQQQLEQLTQQTAAEVNAERERVERIYKEKLAQSEKDYAALQQLKQQEAVAAEVEKIDALEKLKVELEKEYAAKAPQAPDSTALQFLNVRHDVQIRAVDAQITEAQEAIVKVRNANLATVRKTTSNTPLKERQVVLKAQFAAKRQQVKSKHEQILREVDARTAKSNATFNKRVSLANKGQAEAIKRIQASGAPNSDAAIQQVKDQYEQQIQTLSQSQEVEREKLKAEGIALSKQHEKEVKLIHDTYKAERVKLFSPEDLANALAEREAKVREAAELDTKRRLEDASTESKKEAEAQAAVHLKQLQKLQQNQGSINKAKREAEEYKQKLIASEKEHEARRVAYEKLQAEAAAQHITTEQLIQKNKALLAEQRAKHAEELRQLQERNDNQTLVVNGELVQVRRQLEEAKAKEGSMSALLVKQYDEASRKDARSGKYRYVDDGGVEDEGGLRSPRRVRSPVSGSEQRLKSIYRHVDDGGVFGPDVSAGFSTPGQPLGQASSDLVASTLARAQSEYDTKIKDVELKHTTAIETLQSILDERNGRVVELEQVIRSAKLQRDSSEASVKDHAEAFQREKDRLQRSVATLTEQLEDVKVQAAEELRAVRKSLEADRGHQIDTLRKALVLRDGEDNKRLSEAVGRINDETDARLKQNAAEYAQQAKEADDVILGLRQELLKAMNELQDRNLALVANQARHPDVPLGPPSAVLDHQQYKSQAVVFDQALHSLTTRQHAAVAQQVEALPAYNLRKHTGPYARPLPSSQKEFRQRLSNPSADQGLKAALTESVQVADAVNKDARDPSLSKAYEDIQRNKRLASLGEGHRNMVNLITHAQSQLGKSLPVPSPGHLLSAPDTLSSLPTDASALERAVVRANTVFNMAPTNENKLAADRAAELLAAVVTPSEAEYQDIRLRNADRHSAKHIALLDADPHYAATAPRIEESATASTAHQLLSHVDITTAPLAHARLEEARQEATPKIAAYESAEAASQASVNSTQGAFVPVPPSTEQAAVDAALQVAKSEGIVLSLKNAVAAVTGSTVRKFFGGSSTKAPPIAIKDIPSTTTNRITLTEHQQASKARRQIEKEQRRLQSSQALSEEQAAQKARNEVRSQATSALLARVAQSRALQEAQDAASAKVDASNDVVMEFSRQRARERDAAKAAAEASRVEAAQGRQRHHGPRNRKVGANEEIAQQPYLEVLPQRQAAINATHNLQATPSKYLYGSSKVPTLRLKRPKVDEQLFTDVGYKAIVDATIDRIKGATERTPDPILRQAIDQLQQNGHLSHRLAQRVLSRIGRSSKAKLTAPAPDVSIEDALPEDYEPGAVVEALRNVHADSPADRVNIVHALNVAAEVAQQRNAEANPNEIYAPILENLQQGDHGRDNVLFNLAEVAEDEAMSLEDRINFLDVVAHAAGSSKGQGQISGQALSLVHDLINRYAKKPGDVDDFSEDEYTQ